MDKNHPIKLYMINKSKKYKVEVKESADHYFYGCFKFKSFLH